MHVFVHKSFLRLSSYPLDISEWIFWKGCANLHPVGALAPNTVCEGSLSL